MIEGPLIFLAGFLGSAHCVGMCGGFAISIGMGADSWRGNCLRQLVYSVGRIFTYGSAGAVAGFCGLYLAHGAASIINVQAALSLIAGVLLVVQGLSAAGWLPAVRATPKHSHGCLPRSFFRSFLTAPGLTNVFIAGILTGFLPCGLVYAFLALAAGSGSMTTGLGIMALFGAGTVPVMMLTGAGASLLSITARARILKVAALCVILTGISAVSRGVVYWNQQQQDHCPLCQTTVGQSASVSAPGK